ncbi:MAG: hypothetical protein M3119_11870 [Verrucomicrobiota bacterium]|nr:hypothetical protein [Verrucomicrobiota bacterium]MDQ6940841.1 hypothetical protein [Verrucomicrobiota bacterium]
MKDETDFPLVLRTLSAGGIDFVAIGAIAAISHGIICTTEDVDVVYSRAPENLKRIVAALAPFEPYLRGAPPGLPFHLDERTLRSGLNFTFETTMGNVDFLGEASGHTYDDLKPSAELHTAFGVEFFSVALDTLIKLKRSAGRPKDLEMVARLEAARQEKIAAQNKNARTISDPGA